MPQPASGREHPATVESGRGRNRPAESGGLGTEATEEEEASDQANWGQNELRATGILRTHPTALDTTMITTPGMTNERLAELLHEHAQVQEGQPGFWRVIFQSRTLLIVTDESHNRMRIMTPVAEQSELDEATLRTVLSANFDRALDARYATSGEHLWSTFIHPLRELTARQFVDALRQVATLADNFGTSYTSGSLVFGGWS